MKTNRLLFIKAFATLLLFCLLCVTDTLAKPLEVYSKNKKMLVEHKGAKFVIESRWDIPYDNADISRLICEKMFGMASDNVDEAYELYLSRFEKYSLDKGDKASAAFTDGKIEMAIVYHGIAENKFNISLQQDKKALDEEYVRLASRYEPFYCFIANKVAEEKKDTVAVDDMKTMFTYDNEQGRLLNIADVLTPDAISDLDIRDAGSTNVVIWGKEEKVAYGVTEDGEMVIREVSFKYNADMLTKDVLSYFDSLHTNRQNIVTLQAKKIEEQRTIANRMKADYQSKTKKLKSMYLYVWDDTCYVSKLNRDIMTMTDSEIDALAADKKYGYIAAEIRDARRFFANGGQVDKLYGGDSEIEYKLNGNAYVELWVDYVATPSRQLAGYLKEPCSGVKGHEKVSLRYMVDSTGCFRMPIVFGRSDQRFSKLDEWCVAKLRKLGRWVPAIKDGEHVNSVYSLSLSVSKIKVITQYGIPRKNSSYSGYATPYGRRY